jgi:hypothetical protein
VNKVGEAENDALNHALGMYEAETENRWRSLFEHQDIVLRNNNNNNQWELVEQTKTADGKPNPPSPMFSFEGIVKKGSIVKVDFAKRLFKDRLLPRTKWRYVDD